MQSSPPGLRDNHSLVYDAARAQTVLYGSAHSPEGVTWEFDGAQWVARPTPFAPEENRCFFQLAYDSKNEVVILCGGSRCHASGVKYNDTSAYGPDPDGDGIVGG